MSSEKTVKPYVLLDLEQGSDEWISQRMNYITASQVPVLFELSPYQTIAQLFEEKIRKISPPITQTQEILFARGHKAEEKGRQWIKDKMGLEFKPAVAISVHTPMLLASLDGIEEEQNLIFEAKYMGKKKLEEVKEGKIPAYHNCQIQAQLAVTKAHKCIYFAMDGVDAAMTEVFPEPELISRIVAEVMKFSISLHEGIFPQSEPVVFKTRKARS